MPPTATQRPSELSALNAKLAIRGNPARWFQAHGQIKSKEPGKSIKFPELRLNEFQKEVIAIYLYCLKNAIPCRICIVKPRQKGSTTVCQAIFYTHQRNFPGNGMMIAHDADTTEEIAQMWTMFCDTDDFPHWGSSPIETKRGFTNGSMLKLRTANSPNAGRGGTWHAVHASEVAYYKTDGVAAGEVVFASIKGGLHDLPNTLMLQESTANGAMGIHYDTYQGAVSFADHQAGNIPKHWNGFFKVFYPWMAFKDSWLPFTEAEGKDIMANLDAAEDDIFNRFGAKFKMDAGHFKWRRKKLLEEPYKSNNALFERDFPRDDVSCFLTSGNFRFDPDGLTEMDNAAIGLPPPRYCTLDDQRTDILVPANLNRAPILTDVRQAEAWLRVWETPVEGRRYLLAADFMTGEQAKGSDDPDCHAFGVFRDAFEDEHGVWVPKLVAACMPDCRVDTDVCARWIGLLSRMYGCIVVPEINNSNGLVDLLRREKCRHIYHRMQATELQSVGTGKTIRKPGFMTTTSTKPIMIDGLARRIREQEWSVPCHRARAENRVFMTWPSGQMAAAARHHDDWVMMQAIASATMASATIYTTRIENVKENSHQPNPQQGADGF